MLENRSFDHMLGFLYAGSSNSSPLGQPFEGLTGTEANLDASGTSVPVFKILSTDPHPYLMPGANTGEGYLNTNAQLFGTVQAPNPIVPATNVGFITNFASTLAWESKDSGAVIAGTTPDDIMGIYTPETLPILSNLAAGYAVCDHWYGSAPTETFPNRAFAAMGTSLGFVKDSSISKFTAPSIFTLLAAHGATWAVYGYKAQPLTRSQVVDISSAPESHFGKFADFQEAVKSGTLANYVFLEPSWGSTGNSQHPNYDVSQGEQFLHDVYYTLFGSAIWDQTLLIITYDEHGGCYDHVPPPMGAVPPDNSVGESGFDFKRFGPRVPTVLVSPLIAAGTVYRAPGPTPFDHTSILKTLETRFGMPNLTQRDLAAPGIDGVLSLTVPRADDPLNRIVVPTSAATLPAATTPDHLEMALASGAADLPVSDATANGIHEELPSFTSSQAALDYVNTRYQAYKQQRGAG
jgi:phospholipase C